MSKGDYDAAEDALLSCINAGDAPPLAHLALAELYARDPEKAGPARTHLLKYLESNPNDNQAVELLHALDKIIGQY